MTKMGREGIFSLVNDDVLQNILGRLPALSFASAACVNKSWNSLCNRILSRPKLASALSLNPSLEDAVKEVLDKVLSQPIRPHFAIAYVGVQFNLEVVHSLIKEILGSNTPVITNAASGIIGIDALTDELQEVKWELVFEGDDDEFSNHEYNYVDQVNRGIVLVVGSVPGIKVETIPLLRPKQEPEEAMVDKFVMDILNYAASVSGCQSPASIMMFGDQNVDMRPIMAKIDYALAAETVIVGDAGACFLCTSGDNAINYSRDLYFFDAVALIFARDREKSQGIGETQFHVTLSSGITPFGPKLKAILVGAKDSNRSWLSVLVEEHNLIVDGQRLIDEINKELNYPDLYIGVTQHRECSIGLENSSQATSLALYEVLGGDNNFIIVDGVGIKPGDFLLFYHSDSENASASCAVALDNLATLRTGSNGTNTSLGDKYVSGVGDRNLKREVFGGFIFSCYSRGESFFKHPNVDSAPFYLNFPGVPLAGLFCSGEIGRGYMEEEEEGTPRCCVHFYGSVYLAMSYVPPPPQLR